MSKTAFSTNRKQDGQGIIMIVVLIGCLIIPMIGLFVFEVLRYQFAQQAVVETTDAAALAGARRLIDSQATTLAAKQQEALDAAVLFFRKQYVMNVSMGNASDQSTGASDARPAEPGGQNQTVVVADIVNPDNNPPTHVPLGDINGRAVRVRAIFNEVPAFLQHAGITKVGVYGESISGMPRLDIVLAFDMSGSMDDCSRVTFVRRIRKLTPSGQQAYNQKLAERPTPPALDNCDDLLDEEERRQCEQNNAAKCAAYQAAHQAWQNELNAILNDDGSNFIAYEQVAQGKLRQIINNALGQAGAQPIGPNGTQINGLRHRNLSDLNKTGLSKFRLTYSNTRKPLNPSPCGKGSGVTDLVVNMDNRLSIPEEDIEQPLEPLGEIIYQGGFYNNEEGTWDFSRLPLAVEASNGNLDDPATFLQNAFLGSTKLRDNTQIRYGCTFNPRPGYQNAYDEGARRYMQPVATTLAAAEDFMEALENSGRDIRVGIAGYESQAPSAPGPPDPPPTDPDDPYPPPKITEVSIDKEGVVRKVPFVGLVSVTDSAGMQILKDKLKILYALNSTSMKASLEQAYQYLTQSGYKPPPGTKRIIILFTDGFFSPEEEDPRLSGGPAEKCRDAGISIYTIGLAQDANLIPRQTDILGDKINFGNEDGIAKISGHGARYLRPTDAKDVRDTFLQLARRLVNLAG